MTGLLKDIMNERADATHAPEIDVEAVIRNGNTRVRHHRIVGGLAASAAVAAVALVVPTALHGVTGNDGSGPVQPAQGGGYGDRQVTYATGSTIYYGNEGIDVSPHEVDAFVQTDDGFVFTTPDDEVYFTDGRDATALGTAGAPYGVVLVADDSGSYVGWVDFSAEPAPEFVVYDTKSGGEVARTSDGNEPFTDRTDEFALPAMQAIDGHLAYWHSSRGVVAYDLTSGSSDLMQRGASTQWLYDVAAGQFARASFDDQTTAVSADTASDGPYFADAGWAVLSPSARYVATDPNDSTTVWDVESGDDVTPSAPGKDALFLVTWLDDDSFVAATFPDLDDSRPMNLLDCSAGSGTCEVVNRQVGVLGDIQLPTGQHAEP